VGVRQVDVTGGLAADEHARPVESDAPPPPMGIGDFQVVHGTLRGTQSRPTRSGGETDWPIVTPQTRAKKGQLHAARRFRRTRQRADGGHARRTSPSPSEREPAGGGHFRSSTRSRTAGSPRTM